VAPPDPHAALRALAARHGFHVVGVTSAEPLDAALAHLEAWAAAGHAADMRWMTRNPPERADPRTLLATVRSVVTVAVDYRVPAPPFDAAGRYGRVSRYAWGRDYHDVVIPRLCALGAALLDVVDGATRSAVACDHSPLLERAAAARAGLGFVGKNTCLLLPRRGSWVFLGEILLDAELAPTPPAPQDHCGTCVRCLDDCPTDAFPAPYVLDARRCISYLTIEHRGVFPRDLRPRLGPWVFGCDVCQEVCPFNRFAPPADWPELGPEAGVGPRLDLAEVLLVRDDDAFRARFAGTPLLRPKRRGLLRNAAVAAANVGATAAVPALAACVEGDTEPLVRAHALWALGRLDAPRGRRLAERALAGDADADVRDEARALLADPS
jgi:epoxyqueuosine reductase